MIERYIAKHYEWPPCWQLVADVYINELGLSLDDYTPKSNTMRDVANAFRIALHNNKHGFVKTEKAFSSACVKFLNSFKCSVSIWYVIHCKAL